MFPKPETRTETHCMKQGEVDDPNRWLGQMGADCTVTPTKQGADHYSWTVACPKNGVRGTGNGHREAGHTLLDAFTEWKSIYVDYSGRVQRAQIDNN